MNKAILDDISARFLVLIPQEDRKHQERIFFLLEEAHWFYIDFYPNTEKLSLKSFGERLLRHNSIKFKDEDFKEFQRYKKQIPVHGALIFNQHFDKILLVRGFYHDQFFFPKGKKNKNELPIDCAIRETYEEIGYDIDEKVIDTPIKISERFSIYPVYNVKESTKFITKTRNEISAINWIPLKDIEDGEREDLKQIRSVFNGTKRYINNMQQNRFKFDISRFEALFDSLET